MNKEIYYDTRRLCADETTLPATLRSTAGYNCIVHALCIKTFFPPGVFTFYLRFGKPCIRATRVQLLSDNKKLQSYVTYFNSIDTETVKNYIPNDKAFDWLSQNIPLFECPDTTIEKIYYYRWWTFRKHLKQTPDGFVFTEFITPVNHGGKYNTVSSALGHHIYEGRWLRDPSYINQYINFWLYVDKKTPKPHLHAFSSWLQDAVYNYYLVNLNKTFITNNLAELDADYRQWETGKTTARR